MFNLKIKNLAIAAGIALTAAVYAPVAIHAATALTLAPTPLPNLLYIGLPENNAGKIDMKLGSCNLHNGKIREDAPPEKIATLRFASGLTMCMLDAEDQ